MTSVDPTSELEPSVRFIELEIEGMTCASCVARVEKRLGRIEGVHAAVNLATERARVAVPPGTGAAALVAAVESAGYRARVVSRAARPQPANATRSMLVRLIVSAVLTAPVVLIAMVPGLQFAGWQWVALALATPVVAWGGLPFHRATVANLRHGTTTMDTLVTLGTTTAYLWSAGALLLGGDTVYFEVAAGVTVLLLLGRMLEAHSRRRAGAALRDLLEAAPETVARLDASGQEDVVRIEDLVPGDRVVVRPGQRIPVDGVVGEGEAVLDTSLMTGEPLPVDVGPGDAVAGGTVVKGGSLTVRAVAVGADTQLARMARLVETAQLGKAAAQRLADRISAVFVPAVVLLSVATVGGWLLAGAAPDAALTAAIAVLIVACPCALGLATPMALLVGTGRAAQLGILITGPEALERSGRIDTVVFDKTGTLTGGRMSLAGVTAVPGLTEADALGLAAAVEARSEHPIGVAITAAASASRGTVPVAKGFRSTAGWGVRGDVDGRAVSVGRPVGGLPPLLGRALDTALETGGTAVLLTLDDEPAAILALADPLRADAHVAVQRARAAGLEPMILSGDQQGAVDAVASALRVAGATAGATPLGKAEAIERLRTGGRRVAMVGDGVNDAAALAASDLGIALASGADAARDAADITLIRPDPSLAVDAILLSKRTLRVIRGNLFWAFAYNVAALSVAALGLLDPMIAGGAMAFSSLFVVLNSLRLRGFTPIHP